MRLVIGRSYYEVLNNALDSRLSLVGPLERRDSAIGLVLPEYLVDEYKDFPALSIWRWPIPDDSYELTKEGERFCTAELTFLLLARMLRVEELALFGLELCGSYVIDKNDPRGFVSDTVPECTVERLRIFLERCPGAPGSERAKTALRWVADKSSSPMESMLVLLLCLPRRLGGFGLPMPELNVSINELLGLGSPEKGPFVDLIWRFALFSLEYDSDLEHTGSDRLARDSIRRVLLEEAKVRSFSVVNRQINSSYELSRIARIAAKAIGKKFRKADQELLIRNTKLRNRLYELTRSPEDEWS